MGGWLLIDDGPASGARNMAVDEFLLNRVENKGGAPALRLYSFRPPAITLGYHQEVGRAIDLAAAVADELDVVRRITGGRALLHDGELTYSVTSPVGSPFGRGLADTFVTIAGVIVSALRRSGVRAEIGGSRRGDGAGSLTSPCLISTSRYEIIAGGRKISGSAQRRTGRSFIQHGSILLRGGSERIENYLNGGWKGLAGAITTVEAETGDPWKDGELRGHIVDLFGEHIGGEPEKFVFSEDDLAMIEMKTEAKAAELSAGKVAR